MWWQMLLQPNQILHCYVSLMRSILYCSFQQIQFFINLYSTTTRTSVPYVGHLEGLHQSWSVNALLTFWIKQGIKVMKASMYGVDELNLFLKQWNGIFIKFWCSICIWKICVTVNWIDLRITWTTLTPKSYTTGLIGWLNNPAESK